jgi:hypothetical protein
MNDSSLLSPDGLWHSFPLSYATIFAQEQWNSTLHNMQQSALAPEQTNGRPSLLIAMRSLSHNHCLHYQCAKDKILLNDVDVHIIFIMIPLIQKIYSH